MRVLVATAQWFPDFHGGSARVATETSRRLAARGHDVTVLAPESEGRPREERDGTLRLLRALPRGTMSETLSDPRAARRAAGALDGKDFDVAVAHHVTVAAGIVAALPRVPLALVYHASPAREARYAGSRSARQRALAPYLRRLERVALDRADRILVLSAFSRSLLTDDTAAVEKTTVVPAGVDLARFSPGDRSLSRERLGLHPDDELVFTARRLDRRMGLEDLLRACASLVPRHPRVRLVVAGTGELDRELRALRDALGISDRVELVGRVSDAELVDRYRAADLVAVPTAAYEGFGLVTAEALACGTPVVGTRVGATPELLEPLDPSLLAAGCDPDALARTISATLGGLDSQLRERCREYAVARFDWDRAIGDWEEALAQEARARRPRRRFLGAPLDPVRLDEAVDFVDERIRQRRPLRHASLNAAKLVRLRRDRELAEAIAASDLVTADGQPVVWAARLAGHGVPERVAGIDLMEALVARAEERGYRIYLLGGRTEVVAEAAAEMTRRHPRLGIVGSHHGYFTADEEPRVVDAIRAAAPEILFVALGSPQKELFQARNGDLGVPFTMGVGGAFDVIAGRTRRAPRWMRAVGLEWAFRLAQEPRRLFVRYLVGNAVFIALAGQEIVRVRLGRTTARIDR